ncbi:uncharacterized protein [Anabrus simplex]|uniref:uncharacterized protein n=1 Tax=Anabrus simplex TaxID=316456 RepID=UPI0035A2BC76
MAAPRLFIILVASYIVAVHSSPHEMEPRKVESSAEFLESVITHLKKERKPPNESQTLNRISTSGSKAAESPPQDQETSQYKIMGPTPVPAHMDMASTETASVPVATNQNMGLSQLINMPSNPPPPLSKDELMALYQAAVSKGSSLVSMLSNSVKGSEGFEQLQSLLAAGPAQMGTHSSIPGYYYYFYPIKAVPSKNEHTKEEADKKPEDMKMDPTAMMVMENEEKAVEPLFMAMAGFIGMAVMFIVSILFFPKFGSLRSRGISALKNAPDEVMSFTKLIFEAIDGKDCSERISCEVGRAVRRMKLDDRPIRILEILLPPALGKQLQHIRKAASRREKCNFIPCKWKNKKYMVS